MNAFIVMQGSLDKMKPAPGESFVKAGLAVFGILAMATGSALPISAQGLPDRKALVEDAFAHAKATIPTLSVEEIACVANQRQIALADKASLLFPCELQELVEDEFDAAMLVTLLLAEPLSQAPAFESDAQVAAKAAAIGAVAVGMAVGPGSELEVVERAKDNRGVAAPGLAAYAPPDSRVIRAEASRLRREEDLSRTSDRTDEIARERAREKREEELTRQAEYASVTTFLDVSNRLSFCPADGRAFLKRATEYAVSPVQEDRVYGLWADDRRHALEPYLNDRSRCR